MREIGAKAKYSGLLLALMAGLGLSGCAGGIGGADDSGKPSTLASLMAFHSPTPPPMAPEKPKAEEVICPHIEVLDGTSVVRVGGDSNETVRYQYSLGRSARQCDVVGNQVSLKIGLEGRVLLGPKGAPGTFNVPVRFAVVQDSDRKPLVSQLQNISVNIPSGQSEAPFSAVSQPIMLPNHGDMEDQDYTVVLGFDTGKATLHTAKGKHPHRSHKKGHAPS